MKKIVDWFDCFDWDAAIMVFLIIASVLLAVLGIILSLAYSSVAWLWLWLPAALCISVVAGMGWC